MYAPPQPHKLLSRIGIQPTEPPPGHTAQSVVAAVIRSDRPAPPAVRRDRPRTAVAAYMLADGTIHTRTVERPHAENSSLAVLDAFADFYSLAEQSTIEPVVFIEHLDVRNALRAAADSFPRVHFCDVARDRLTTLFHAASDALPSTVDARQRINVGPKAYAPILIATDASLRRGRRGAGLGVVDENGLVHTDFVPDVSNIHIAEMLAVELAVRRYRDRKMTVLTDSSAAARLLGNCDNSVPAWLPSRYHHHVENLRSALRRCGSDVQWVHGHRGHLLNEAADRAAVAARRNREFGVSDATAAQICLNIGESVRTVAA